MSFYSIIIPTSWLRRCRLLLLLRWTSFICISLLVCFTLYALTVGTDDGLRRFEWIQTKNISEYVFPNKVTTVLDQPDLCHDDVQLLIIVCSAPKNLQAREAIRETWGGEATRNSDTKLVFFLGQSDNGSYKEKIKTERQLHADIIVEDFIDSYMNLTLKTVFMLKWVLQTCPKIQHLFKIDDDIFLNVEALRHLLTSEKETNGLLRGYLYDSVKPIRDPSSKWFIPTNLYSESTYPPFLSGTAYILSGGIFELLYKTALLTPLITLEDVFLTGLVASQTLGIQLRHVPGFHITKPYFDYACNYQHSITNHNVSPKLLRIIWLATKDSNLDCNSFTSKVITWLTSWKRTYN